MGRARYASRGKFSHSGTLNNIWTFALEVRRKQSFDNCDIAWELGGTMERFVFFRLSDPEGVNTQVQAEYNE